MAEISLPSRNLGAAPRTRGLRLPGGAESVPQVREAADPGVRVPQGAFGGLALGEFGKGLAAAGDRALIAAEKQQKRYDFTETERRKLQFDSVLGEEWRRWQVEEDVADPKAYKTFVESASQRVDDILGSLPDDVSQDAREKLRFELLGKVGAWEVTAGQEHLKAQVAQSDNALQDSVNALSAQARQNPDFLDDFLGEGREALDGLRGTLSPDKEADWETSIRRDLLSAAVDGEMDRGNFDRAAELLNDERFIDDLDPKERGALGAEIDRRRLQFEDRQIALIDRAERKAKEAEKERSDNLTKEGIALAAKDGLSVEWVLDRQNVLSQEDFGLLMKAATGEDGGTDDRRVVADLYEAIASGEDVERDAITAFSAGQIRRETMNTILGRNDSSTRRTAPGTSFERASTYLKSALRPSELNDNPDAAAAYANAEADLMSFFDENPKADVDQAMTYARSLASAYRIAPDTALSLPFFNWMQGDRNAKQPDLDATEQKVFEDLAAGVINVDEARRRAGVVSRWRSFQELGMQ